MRATARVERCEAGEWRWSGTAYFVAEHTLLTCAHVVAEDDDLRIVWYDGERRHALTAGIVSRHPNLPIEPDFPVPDVAVLEVGEQVPAHPTAWLDGAAPGEHLWAFGYTDEYREDMALGHPARFGNGGRAYSEDDGGEVWALSTNRIKPGMSGAPVLDLATGRVVAMVKRTRDPVQGLGGYAVGMDTILEELPDVAAANVAADADERDRRLEAALWGDLVLQAAAPLERSAIARAAVITELGLSEAALHGDDAAQARQLARELFVADLEQVVASVTRLAKILDPVAAGKVFEAVATCTSFEGEPWVAPAAAAELDQQVALLAAGEETVGRVLAIRSGLPELRAVYRIRGDRRRRWWEPLDSTPFSAEVDPGTGLPADLERELRIGIARRLGPLARQFAAAELDPEASQKWENKRLKLVTKLRDRGVVALLACKHLDAQLLNALVARYPLVFLIASSAAVADDVATLPAYQELDPGIDDERAEDALFTYSGMCTELGLQAGGTG
jgi:hypothetical protein